MRKAAVWGFVVLALGLLFTSAQAQRSNPPPETAGVVADGQDEIPEGDPSFWTLACVKIEVSDSRKGDTFGPTQSAVENRVLVDIRAKVPRLSIDSGCKNWLRLSIVGFRIQSKGGVETGWAAYVSLALDRVVLVEEHKYTIASVWMNGGILAGPLDGASGSIHQEVDELVDSFAAEYYKAKNP